jgi:aldose 1-epimerase
MSDPAIISAAEHDVEIFTLRAGGGEARIAPAWGANLFSWTDGDVAILEPVPLADIAARPTSYGIPLLLPFPNRMSGGGFEYGGRRFEVDPPRHGFVRSRPWRMVDAGVTATTAWISCEFDARHHSEVLAQFPSPFRVQLTVRLGDGALDLQVAVTNVGDQVMPFGFGIHPYFRRPANGTLVVPASRCWQLADSLPTGEQVEVDADTDLRAPRDLSELELDHIYTGLAAGADGRARCVLADLDTGLSVLVEADAALFPHSVIYTAPSPREAICIEPYTCPTDAFNLAARGVPANVIELAAAETIELDLGIRVERAR